MSTTKARSGRHSRFPAVNREGRSAPTPAAVPDPEPAPPVEVEASAPEIDLSELSAKKVLDWAGDDDERRAVALDAEQSRDDPRKTVLRELDPNFEG